MKIILFLGFSGGGKTRTIAALTHELVKKRRKKVATIKRIHEVSFTLDTKGKDTWLHASAGASIVLAVAPGEIDLIRRDRNTSKLEAKELLAFFSGEKIDYLLVEGLHKKFESLRGVKSIVCARTAKEAEELIKNYGHKEPIFVTGKFAGKFRSNAILGVPVLYLPNDNPKALSLIG